MTINGWYNGYKVTAFKWIDNENIYFNVQYFRPGSSLSQPPAIDKTAYIRADARGWNMVSNFTSTLAEYVARLDIPAGGSAIISVG